MPAVPGFHVILFAASFLVSLASGMENYALIFYVRELFGADKTAVGWISGCFDLAYLAGILVFLRWKAPHPRKVLAASGLAMALCIAVFLLVPNWTVTFVFHALFGVAMALFWPRIMGWLSWGAEGVVLTRTMGLFNTSWSLGAILSPWLGGLLVELDPRWPFMVAIVLLAAMALLFPVASRRFPAMRHPAPKQPTSTESAGDKAPAAGLGLSPLRYAARVGIAATYFFSGTLLFIFPVWAKESLGFSESLTGSLLLVRMVAATLGFSLWGRWGFWHHKFWPLAVGGLALASLVLLFPLGTALWQFYLLFAAAGLLFSFLYSNTLFHGVSGSLNRERSTTFHEALINIGLFLGTVLGGWVSQTWSMDSAFTLCAAVIVVLVGLQTVLYSANLRHARHST
jgi:DHA1 family multidrug resistance protein-like MFS transporter/DHA1 family quinolone resistance protein-like MFS transporter